MSKKEHLEILRNKYRANEADYNLNRQTAKISALASGDLGKYEYLTGEDLYYRSNPVEKAKFEYSSLGRVFKEGLTDEEKKESTGVFKKLDDIHRTNREILRRTSNNNNNNDDNDDDNKKEPSKDKKEPSKDKKKKPSKDKKKKPSKDEEDDNLKYSSMYTFNKYKITELDNLTSLQSKFNYINEFAQKRNRLYEVRPRNDTNKAKKQKVYNSLGKRYNKLLDEYIRYYNNFIKNKDASNFPEYNPNKFTKARRYDHKSFESTDTFYSAEENPRTSTSNDEQQQQQLNDQRTFEELDNAVRNGKFLLYNNDETGIQRTDFVNIEDFVNKITNMTNKKKYEKNMKAYKTVLENCAKNVESNKRDLLELGDKIYDLLTRHNNITGRGLNNIKILTRLQMFTRLPILLAQIQASNNSQKLKNEARQLLYSLYKSKMISKTIYHTLIRKI